EIAPPERSLSPASICSEADLDLPAPTCQRNPRSSYSSQTQRALRHLISFTQKCAAHLRCSSRQDGQAVFCRRRHQPRRPTSCHACCGVVRSVCCDVSAFNGAVAEVSAAPPPKPAIACTS